MVQKTRFLLRTEFFGGCKGGIDATHIDPLDYRCDCITRDRICGAYLGNLCNREWLDCRARDGVYPGLYQRNPASDPGFFILRIYSADPRSVHAGNQRLYPVAVLANRRARVWSRLFRARFLVGILGRVGGQYRIFRLVDVLEGLNVKILCFEIEKTGQQL